MKEYRERVGQGREVNKKKPLERQGRDICSKNPCRQDHSGNDEAS